jgi:hypothetical protein
VSENRILKGNICIQEGNKRWRTVKNDIMNTFLICTLRKIMFKIIPPARIRKGHVAVKGGNKA